MSTTPTSTATRSTPVVKTGGASLDTEGERQTAMPRVVAAVRRPRRMDMEDFSLT